MKIHVFAGVILLVSMFISYGYPEVFGDMLMKEQAKEYLKEGIKEQKKGNIDYSISLYQKAIYADQKNIRALNNLGTAYAQKGLYIKAEETYRRAIKIDPYYSVALMNLALLYAQRKDFDTFFEFWKRAQGLDIYTPFLIDDEED